MAGVAATVGATERMSPLQRIKAILGGSAGNLVEWYDWFAYSSTSLYFAAHFFPKGDAVAQQLQTAAIFAAGFIARPAGAWLMGVYAYSQAFRQGNFGFGAAISIVMVAILLIVTVFYIRQMIKLGETE